MTKVRVKSFTFEKDRFDVFKSSNNFVLGNVVYYNDGVSETTSFKNNVAVQTLISTNLM